MDDARPILEAAAEHIRPNGDALEGVEHRRRQRDRNRRIRAGALALCIGVAGVGVTAIALEETAPGNSADGETSIVAVWPEDTITEAEAAQAAADANDPDSVWRLDEIEVARRFVVDALGWAGCCEFLDNPQQPDGSIQIAVSTTMAPCPTPAPEADAFACHLPRTAILTVDQPIRNDDGGIWSVTSVASDRFRLALAAGDSLPDARHINIEAMLPEGADGFAGFSGADGACTMTELQPSGVTSVAVPPSADACGDGGLFAFAVALAKGVEIRNDDDFDPLGAVNPVAAALVPLSTTSLEPSLEPATTQDADPIPTQEPGTQGQPTDVLEVDCSDGKTSLASSKVQVQTDGVHIRVRSPGGSLFATLQGRDAGQFDTFTKRLHDQVTRFVYPYPPGTIYVRCTANEGSLGSGADELQRIEVLDPQGIWISDELACPPEEQVQASGFRASAGALSEMESSPEQAIRSHVPGVRSTDEVLIAQYGRPTPRIDQVWMIIRRDAKVLAHFQVNGHEGTWGVHWGDTCKGSGVADKGDEPINGSTISS